MKKLIVAIILATSSTLVLADGRHRGGHGHSHRHSWVAPALAAGVITYALTRQQPIIVEQPPVYYYAPVPQYRHVVPQQQCWVTNQYYNHFGQIIREYRCQ